MRIFLMMMTTKIEKQGHRNTNTTCVFVEAYEPCQAQGEKVDK